MAVKKPRYVVLPNDNVFNENMQTESLAFFRKMYTRRNGSSLGEHAPRRLVESEVGKFKVLDTIDLNDTALVQMTPQQAAAFSRHYPTLRVEQEVMLTPMKSRPTKVAITRARLPRKSVKQSLTVRSVDADTGAAVTGAELVVIFDRDTGQGLENIKTDQNGIFQTAIPSLLKSVDEIICQPLADYWPAHVQSVKLSAGDNEVVIACRKLAAGHVDGIDRLVVAAGADDGKGVKIAIIDTGCDPVAGMRIVKGLNTTEREPGTDFHDNGSGHGTHVAGIIARLAPAAQLYIYRVFDGKSGIAGEFAISKAIRDAVEEGCDLINLSLGQHTEPTSVSRETRRARAMGSVCISAAGNDYGGPVLYPARSHVMIAVSALGVRGSWPDGSMTYSTESTKPKRKGNIFFANFSNYGDEIDFIGPGCGIISNVSTTKKGVMDGTSMACPAITGLVARLLSKDSGLLSAFRDQQRSDDIIKMIHSKASSFGFGDEFEGSGLMERS